ncbi:MAG TPA: DUF2304 domain-containing protein [Solirubrobacteraceae bacterium]|jgi:hypothetical protein|nr:DUF2304 domain-containing protein [Solirubrobacteraceae bacterium]
MQARVQLVAIAGAALLLLAVLEMVRRRRLMERYALLWILSALTLLGLALWNSALVSISHAIGVIYPPNALFFVGIGFILLLLLHFSAAVSRLTDQTDTLAQRQALLEERLRRQERSLHGPAPERRPQTPPEGLGEQARAAGEAQRSAAPRQPLA